LNTSVAKARDEKMALLGASKKLKRKAAVATAEKTESKKARTEDSASSSAPPTAAPLKGTGKTKKVKAEDAPTGGANVTKGIEYYDKGEPNLATKVAAKHTGPKGTPTTTKEGPDSATAVSAKSGTPKETVPKTKAAAKAAPKIQAVPKQTPVEPNAQAVAPVASTIDDPFDLPPVYDDFLG